MTSRLGESLAPLRERPFRLLWVGQTTSAIGDAMTPVALTFAVLDAGSASDLGVVFAAYTISQVVFILAGGVWADRLERRLVMLGADVVRAVVHGAVGVALLAGAAELWHFVAAAAIGGAAQSFFGPASTGLIPQTVSAARLQQANALIGMTRSGTWVLGPALSGLVVGTIGSGWVFAIDGVTFLVSAFFLARLRVVHETLERQTFLRDLAAGWREVRARRWLWASLLGFGFGNMAWGAQGILGPVVAEQELGGAAAWGALGAAMGVGGIAGAALALRWRPDRILLASTVVTFLMGVYVAAFAVLPLAGLLPLAALASVSIMVSNTLWETTLQQHVPRHVLSRVSSYDWMVSLVFMPVGFVMWGPLSEWIGLDAILWLAAGGVVAAHAVVLLVPEIWTLRRADAAGIAEPEPLAVG